MGAAERRTIIAHGRLKMREVRLDAARHHQHGLQVMTFEQLAARLAGGLSRAVDDDSLRETIKSVLPETELGELEGIKALPGMVSAAADTLRKAWRAGVDLQARAADHPRLKSMAILEGTVLQALPPAMMRPWRPRECGASALGSCRDSLWPYRHRRYHGTFPCLAASASLCLPRVFRSDGSRGRGRYRNGLMAR